MAILFKNNAASTLSNIYISSTGKFSDLYVADSSVFPSITAGTGDYFYLTLVGDDTLEIVKAFETGTNSSGGAGYPTSVCQSNSQVGNAAGGGGCSAYNGYIAGGGGAGASGDLMAVTGWATPGWANDTHTHPDNDGAGQVGAVIITSTWDL